MAWVEDAFGNVLMIRQKRGRGLWSLPGGKVRARESLAGALSREILEETGLRTLSAQPVEYYDRHKKANLTVLFRVTLRQAKARPIRDKEIAEVGFRSDLPKTATPSLAFFWKRLRTGMQNPPAKA